MNTTQPPTAVEPSRVLVLTEDEQHTLIDVLDAKARMGSQRTADGALQLLMRVAHGDEYLNEVDELTRLTLRKRRLEEETRRANRRIADLEPMIVEQWAQGGRTGEKHAQTGATLRLVRKVWAKLNVDVDGLDKEHADAVRADAKARAGAVLMTLDDFDGLVQPSFNMNTLSALFRALVKEHDETQRELPEHQRTPLDLQSVLPEALRPLIRLDDTPSVQVRS